MCSHLFNILMVALTLLYFGETSFFFWNKFEKSEWGSIGLFLIKAMEWIFPGRWKFILLLKLKTRLLLQLRRTSRARAFGLHYSLSTLWRAPEFTENFLRDYGAVIKLLSDDFLKIMIWRICWLNFIFDQVLAGGDCF